jgi:formate C-acetyltransferase
LDDPANRPLPFVLRRAKAVESALLTVPISIEEDDLVIGNSLREGVVIRTRMPGYATDEERRAAKDLGISIETGLSHKTPDYPTLMEKGLSGIVVDIGRRMEEIRGLPSAAQSDGPLAFLEAMQVECRAVTTLANRYARLAAEMAERAPAESRRAELRAIAEVCLRVPEFPPRTFREAVQSFWFLNYAFQLVGTGAACGRIDQFLHPFLAADLEGGRITQEEAQELVDCLWLRFNDRAQICRENFYAGDEEARSGNGNRAILKPSAALKPFGLRGQGVVEDPTAFVWEAGHRKRFQVAKDQADAINHFGKNMLISGIRPDGFDGTNQLTYMFLDACERFALTSPVLTVRLHRGSPPELLRRVAEVLKNGGGMPYIDNDEVIVQAYADLGVPLEDARDYSNSNCWETMIQGKSDQEMIRGINFPLFLELALNRGVSDVHGKMGPDTGDPRRFVSFGQLMEAWKIQTDHQIREGIDYIGGAVVGGTLETTDSPHGRYCYNPLLSALTLDCVERARDLTKRGARYTIWHVMAEGAANAIDSMAAIKKLVYEEKTLSMDELLAALEADWQGHETLRGRILAQGPKYANDNDCADDLGREMFDHFVERTRVHAARWTPEVIFPCSAGTFSWIISLGKEVGATPDGRCHGEPIAANLCPAPGADASGPTAAINSYVKMRVGDMAAGAPLDLRLSKSGLEGESGTRRLAGLIGAFVDLGGNMLTLTVTDVEELKRAMKEPEKYRHLRVRMGGWSAYFVMLSRQQQLLHIRRVEHGLR